MRTLTLLAALVAVPALAGGPLTAEALVAKHLDAVGGVEKLKAAKTFTFKAKLIDAEGTGSLTAQRMRPNFMRYDSVKANGNTFTKACDGNDVWLAENGKAKEVPAEKQAMLKKKAADFDDALVDYQAKGHQVALGGEEKVAGAAAYKLVVTLADGSVETRYLDQKSLMEVKRTTVDTRYEGKKAEHTVLFSDWRKVDGLMVNFASQWEGEGGKTGKMILESASYSTPLTESVFKQTAPRS